MRLLVVDDDVAVRMSLAMALDGVEVVEGWRADGVAELAVAERVDAVLLDRRLPDGDGLDLVRALRANPATAALPVVVVTADDDPKLRPAAFDAGADEHAVKPLDPERVVRLVRALEALGHDQRRVRRTVHRARLRAGRDDGGWVDLLPDASTSPGADAVRARGRRGRGRGRRR